MIDERLYYAVIRVVLVLWVLNFIVSIIADFSSLEYTQAGVINGSCGGVVGIVVAAGVRKHVEKSKNDG